MKHWKKWVAACVAIPTLMAMVPSAAADETGDSSSLIEQAVQSATATPSTRQTSAGLLASLDFNDLTSGATGELADDATGAKATINGSAATGVGADGTAAAQLGSGFWLDLKASDGSALLKGRNAITLSYDSKAVDTKAGWALYAAPDATAAVYSKERYLGVMDQASSLSVQRYNNSGSRNNSGNVSKTGLTGQWKRVDIVIEENSSKLYIDGAEVNTATPDEGRTLTDILGDTGGILQIGKGNWSNGEYFTGQLDNLKIYGSARSAQQIKDDYVSSQAQLADADANALTIPDKDDVRGSITLPTQGSVNGSAITWKSSNPAVVSDADDGGKAAGVVNRQSVDTKVTLTATVTPRQGQSVTKKFELTVKAAVAFSPSDATDYMFAYFADNTGQKENIYFATSEDGDHWLDLSNNDTSPSLTTDVGKKGVRDPFLIRSPQGDKFYIIATDLEVATQGWGGPMSTKIQMWESTDLKHWDGPYLNELAAPLGDVEKMWAPEAYWDEATQQYFIYWATNCQKSCPGGNIGNSLNMYIATTRDFKTFSEPKLWIDRQNSAIDVSVIKIGDWYYRIAGDGDLNIEKSKKLDAPTTGIVTERTSDDQWVKIGTLADFVGKETLDKIGGVEGFEWVTYNADDRTTDDGKPVYALIADQYGKNAGYRPFRFTDIEDPTTWDTDFTDFNWDAIKKRHGGIISVTPAERKALESSFVTQYVDPATAAQQGSQPEACYDFENAADKGKDSCGTNDLTLNGSATTSADADAESTVLSLDGSAGGYAQFPQGFFDGKSQLTVQMDVKSEQNGNFFIFAFGKDSSRYYFLRNASDGSLRSAITKGSSGVYEDAVTGTTATGWHKVTIVFNERSQSVYSDGVLIGKNISSNPVNWIGNDLQGYLGKSFYDNDKYFNGSLDNIKIWNRALSAKEITGSEKPDTPTSDVLANLTFDDLKADDTGALTDTASNAKATVQGKAAVGKGKDGTTAAKMSKDFWLNVTKKDGTPLLDGVKDLTVSFDAKPDSSNNNGWAFYAAPNTDSPEYNKSEHYLGVISTSGNAKAERYNTDGNRDTRGNAEGSVTNDWHRITVSVSDTFTRVYVDGALVDESTDVKGLGLSDILGAGGGILQLGKANWKTGEYYSGLLDNVKIWNRTLTTDEIADMSPVVLQSITVGTKPTAQEAADLRGTDDHTLVRSEKNDASKTVTTVLNKRANVAKTPVSVAFNRSADTVKLTVDGKAFTSGGTLDMSKDHQLVITYADKSSETWTLKAVTISNNPVLPGQYADPDIDYFDGKFWIFPTTDGFSGWKGNYFHAFSSTNMVDWKDEGVILDADNSHQPTTNGDKNTAISTWSIGSAWAPTMEKKNSEYYFYYCAKLPSGVSAIGVAVADNPAGPYKAAPQPLVTNNTEGVKVGQAIDPSVFTDTDGKSYILYGNGSAAIAQLGDDMMSIVPGSVKKISGLDGFRESVVVAERDGVYHWTWSCDDAGSANYHVNYGTSTSLFNADGSVGPTANKKAWLLGKDDTKGLQGTAHQSDVNVVDAAGDSRWFMAYHRHYTPLGVFTSGLGYHRETAIDEIHFDGNGLMQTIQPTDEGAGEVIMADFAALSDAVDKASSITNQDYTAHTWSAFETARDGAKTKLATMLDHGISQADVDAAAASLRNAQAGLVKVDGGEPEQPVKPEQPTQPEQPTKPGNGDANNGNADNGDAAAGQTDRLTNTGAAIGGIVLVALLALAGGISIIVRSRRPER
jgi:hypothetical protein